MNGSVDKVKVAAIVLVALMLTTSVALAIDSAKWRGVAATHRDAADSALVKVAARGDSLSILRARNADLVEGYRAIDAQRVQDREQYVRDSTATQGEIERLTAAAATDIELDEAEAHLMNDLDAAAQLVVMPVVSELRGEIALRDSIIIEQWERLAQEVARADTAVADADRWRTGALSLQGEVFTLTDQVADLTTANQSLQSAFDALERSIHPSLWTRAKSGWPWAAAGAALAFVLTRSGGGT